MKNDTNSRFWGTLCFLWLFLFYFTDYAFEIIEKTSGVWVKASSAAALGYVIVWVVPAYYFWTRSKEASLTEYVTKDYVFWGCLIAFTAASLFFMGVAYFNNQNIKASIVDLQAKDSEIVTQLNRDTELISNLSYVGNSGWACIEWKEKIYPTYCLNPSTGNITAASESGCPYDTLPSPRRTDTVCAKEVLAREVNSK